MPILLALALYYGPYYAYVVKVVDSITVMLDVAVWPGQVNRVTLRLRGVDTPLPFGACETETLMAKDAKAFTRTFLSRQVVIYNIRATREDRSKLWGQIRNDRGEDLKRALIEAGYAAAHRGDARTGWCPHP